MPTTGTSRASRAAAPVSGALIAIHGLARLLADGSRDKANDVQLAETGGGEVA